VTKMAFTTIEIEKEIPVYGLSGKSNDKTQAKDIPALAKKYYEAAGKNSGEVIPFFVISKEYDETTRDFQLFIGGLIENKALEAFVIPRGTYGKVTIKPKLGFLWGLSIGAAKRAFYTQWLPKSKYTALNLEYEYHAGISKGKNPQMELLFGVRMAQIEEAQGEA